jgi:polyisoprenyl-phosphate glycosyltransferase
MKQKIIIVTPIYEDNDSAEKLLSELKDIYKEEVFIVAVDDGSLVNPFNVNFLKRISIEGVVVELKKNVGHQMAIAIGLQYVSDELEWAEKVVVMDSDGEDSPYNIKALTDSCDLKNVDVAVGSRRARSESRQFIFFYNIYKIIFKMLTGRSIAFGNFMCIKSNALKRIVIMPELWTHLAACVLSSKLRLSSCSLDRGERYFGQSKSNFIGFALHGFKALMVFSEQVLVRVGVFCAIISLLSVLGGFIAVLLKFVGIATPGWFSIVMGIFILVFLQTGTLTLMSLLLTGGVGNHQHDACAYKPYVNQVHKSNP